MSALLSIDAQALNDATFPISISSHTTTSLALVGDWQPLFDVLCGLSRAPSGAIEVLGQDARSSVLDASLGVLPEAVQWPAGQRVFELLELSASLLGLSKSEAAEQARRVLGALELAPQQKQLLSRLPPLQMRRLGIAHALLGGPRTLALQNPVVGLTTPDARALMDALGRVAVEQALIVSVPHADPGSPERELVDRCSEVIVLRQGAITLHGPPARLADAGGLLQLTVTGAGSAALRQALLAEGVVVRSITPLAQHPVPASNQLERVVVELTGGQSTLPLFRAAKSCDATLLELRSLANVE